MTRHPLRSTRPATRARVAAASLLAALAIGAPAVLHAQSRPTVASSTRSGTTAGVAYRTVRIDGIDVFYREAGPKDAPTVLLLHGFPSSSHMYRALIPALADRYHVIAPDMPGFGRSAMPTREAFRYTFANLARVTDRFTQALGLERYALYVMDYGAPVGLRLAVAHPERVTALVVQNGNAYEDGLREFWQPLRRLWASGAPADRDSMRVAFTPDFTRWQYLHGVRDSSRVSPDAWTLDQRYLDRPGNDEIQLDLFYDYRTNVAMYPAFQAYFRRYQPPTLVVWGRNDVIFPPQGAEAFRRDLASAEIHLLDTGHFALEDKGAEIAGLMHAFLDRHVARGRGTTGSASSVSR